MKQVHVGNCNKMKETNAANYNKMKERNIGTSYQKIQ